MNVDTDEIIAALERRKNHYLANAETMYAQGAKAIGDSFQEMAMELDKASKVIHLLKSKVLLKLDSEALKAAKLEHQRIGDVERTMLSIETKVERWRWWSRFTTWLRRV